MAMAPPRDVLTPAATPSARKFSHLPSSAPTPERRKEWHVAFSQQPELLEMVRDNRQSILETVRTAKTKDSRAFVIHKLSETLKSLAVEAQLNPDVCHFSEDYEESDQALVRPVALRNPFNAKNAPQPEAQQEPRADVDANTPSSLPNIFSVMGDRIITRASEDAVSVNPWEYCYTALGWTNGTGNSRDDAQILGGHDKAFAVANKENPGHQTWRIAPKLLMKDLSKTMKEAFTELRWQSDAQNQRKWSRLHPNSVENYVNLMIDHAVGKAGVERINAICRAAAKVNADHYGHKDVMMAEQNSRLPNLGEYEREWFASLAVVLRHEEPNNSFTGCQANHAGVKLIHSYRRLKELLDKDEGDANSRKRVLETLDKPAASQQDGATLAIDYFQKMMKWDNRDKVKNWEKKYGPLYTCCCHFGEGFLLTLPEHAYKRFQAHQGQSVTKYLCEAIINKAPQYGEIMLLLTEQVFRPLFEHAMQDHYAKVAGKTIPITGNDDLMTRVRAFGYTTRAR